MNRSVLTIMVAVTVAGAAFAEERTIGLRDATVVQDGRGSARVLFRTAALSLSTNEVIDRAELVIPYTGAVEERSLELRVCPVTASWGVGADWTTVFDEELYARSELDLKQGSGAMRFDVTVPLAAMREHGLVADGFVLTVAGERGMPVTDVARLSSLAGATLTVSTIALPSGRPPQGWLDRHGR